MSTRSRRRKQQLRLLRREYKSVRVDIRSRVERELQDHFREMLAEESVVKVHVDPSQDVIAQQGIRDTITMPRWLAEQAGIV